jgi:acetolactate synthase regulatory subunit
MPNYRVEINGQNFLIEMDGRVAKHGFFTTRFVEAADPAAAEHAAVQMIRETQRLRDLVRNDLGDPPVMDVISIVELVSDEGIESREPGFVWHEERPRYWWQFWRR